MIDLISNIVKVSIGHQSQVADGHLGWAQMSNEAQLSMVHPQRGQ